MLLYYERRREPQRERCFLNSGFEVTDVRKVPPGLDGVRFLWREKRGLSNEWFLVEREARTSCLRLILLFEMSSLMT